LGVLVLLGRLYYIDHVKIEVFTAVGVMMMMIFRVVTPFRLDCRCCRFGEHTVFIFRAEVAMLGSGGICIVLEEGKVERGPLRE
jgi:hypothetical protein